MKKILFVIGSLQIGGAETVMVDIINNIYKEFDITVLLIEKRGELLKMISPSVKLKYLTKSKEYCSNFVTAFYNKIKLSLIYRFLSKKKFYVNKIYKKILNEQYDTEIAFLAGVPGDIVSKSPNRQSKKIAWIHNCVDINNNKSYKNNLVFTKTFDEIVAVSKGSYEVFKSAFPNIEGNLILIHNFVDVNKIYNKSKEKIANNYSKDKINFLSLGRLSFEKGFDRIINIAKKYEDKINFYIGGVGPKKQELEQLIQTNQIKNVFLLGLLKNPYPYLRDADVFLLSSRSEAYPTVLIEAMILNKFIIATNVAGVEEILEGYNNKIIIKNTDQDIELGISNYLAFKKSKRTNENNFRIKNEKNLQKVKDLIK